MMIIKGHPVPKFNFCFTCVKLIYLGTSKISKKHKDCLDTGHTGHVFGTGHEKGPPTEMESKYNRRGIDMRIYIIISSGIMKKR